MVFSSNVFLMAFLPVTLLLYFLVPKRYLKVRNAVLLAVSLFFYGWGEPKYILVMLASILFNYFLALAIAAAFCYSGRKPWNFGILQVYRLFN